MTRTSQINDFSVKDNKPQLSVPRSDWYWAIAGLLSLSMIGLKFPLGFIFLAIILINRYYKDKYDFLILLTIFFGGFGFISDLAYPIKMRDIAFLLSICLMFLYRKDYVLKRITFFLLCYFAVLIFIMTQSEEAMNIQLKGVRNYMMIIYLFVPLAIFSGRSFDMHIFMKKLLVYVVVISVFYVLDGFVFSGWFLVPGTFIGEDRDLSTFTNITWAPFTTYFPRKYPPGLYLMALCIYPILHYYKLSKKHWIMIFLSFAACRTLTFIVGLVVTYFAFQGRFVRFLKYIIYAIVIITALYFIDNATGSFLRVQSTIDQFISLSEVEDDEDLGEFGSGRMAQIIPKVQLLYDYDMQWTGFGFLVPDQTTNPKFIIENDLYVDIEKSEEVATGVEVTQLETFLTTGYVGVIAQYILYIGLYFIIRRLKYSKYYLVVLVAISLFGIGGYTGLNRFDGLGLLGLTLGVILLANKPISLNKDDTQVINQKVK